MEEDEKNGMSAEKAGHFVARYAMKKSSRPLVSMGAGYKVVSLLVRVLPTAALQTIVGKIYG